MKFLHLIPLPILNTFNELQKNIIILYYIYLLQNKIWQRTVILFVFTMVYNSKLIV